MKDKNRGDKFPFLFISLDERGFTLLELLLSLIILGLIINISIFSSNYFMNRKINEEILELVDDITSVRHLALIDREIYMVNFNKNENYYLIRKGNNENVYKKKELKYGLYIDSNRNVPKYVFKKDGRIGSSGTLYLKSKEKNYQLIVRPVVGKIRLVVEEGR